MAGGFQGYSALGAIGHNPKLFEALSGEVERHAEALLTRQLRAADLTTEALRAIRAAIGDETLGSIVEGLSKAHLGAIVKRLDPHGAAAVGLASGLGVGDAREHIMALARGDAQPAAKPAKAADKAAAKRKDAPAPQRLQVA